MPQFDNNMQCDLIFLDSGIGGIPYLRHFMNNNKNVQLAYIADNKNFPYGGKTKQELLKILNGLVEKTIYLFNAKIIVLACNTASISTLDELRAAFSNIAFVGTVPAVRPAIKACKTGSIGVLGTERTIEDDYIQNLVLNTNAAVKLNAVAAPELVDFVERSLNIADENAKTQIVKKYIDKFRNKNVDGIVLGCTHFLFLVEDFKKAAGDEIKIFDSIEGVSSRVETLIKNDCFVDKIKFYSEEKKIKNIFAVTKNTDGNLWQKRAYDLNMNFTVIE